MLRSVSENLSAISNNVQEHYFTIPFYPNGTEPPMKAQYNSLWLGISAFSYKLDSVSTHCASRLRSRVEAINSFINRVIEKVRNTALENSISIAGKCDKLEKTFNDAIFELAKIISE